MIMVTQVTEVTNVTVRTNLSIVFRIWGLNDFGLLKAVCRLQNLDALRMFHKAGYTINFTIFV